MIPAISAQEAKAVVRAHIIGGPDLGAAETTPQFRTIVQNN